MKNIILPFLRNYEITCWYFNKLNFYAGITWGERRCWHCRSCRPTWATWTSRAPWSCRRKRSASKCLL